MGLLTVAHLDVVLYSSQSAAGTPEDKTFEPTYIGVDSLLRAETCDALIRQAICFLILKPRQPKRMQVCAVRL